MRLEKYLPVQVVEGVATHVMPDQGDGDDERDEALAAVVNEFRRLAVSA